MRLLKRHTDETEADRAETDVPVVEEAAVDTEPAVETDADEPAVEEAAIDTEAVKTEPGDTDTDEPVDEPTAIVPARSVGRASTWSRMSLGPLLAIVAGAAFVAFGCIVLTRTGLDATWYRPREEVLDADHTALLGVLEIGVGVILLLAGVTGSRVLVAILGLAMALGATAMAIDPEELQRELAIERWWAWTLAALGVALTLSALQAPRRRRQSAVDAS
jgi:hypothetical protein